MVTKFENMQSLFFWKIDNHFISGNGGSTDTANTARRFLGEKRKEILNIVDVSESFFEKRKGYNTKIKL